MVDYFSLLEESRLPWLDQERLKAKFLALSAPVHPDRFHSAPEADRAAAGRRFTDLNSAYNCLRDTKERLRHLIELATGIRPKDIERVPAELLEYFADVGSLCRQVDAFLAERSTAASPILKAQQFQRGLEWTDKINAMLNRIQHNRQTLEVKLKAMSTSPVSSSETNPFSFDRLEEIYRLFGYYGRWTAQLQERNVQLAA